MLRLFIGKDPAEVKIFKFPAGESGVSFNVPVQKTHLHDGLPFNAQITLKWEGNDDLINLALLVDAIRRKYDTIELNMTIDYFPYARQDRVCNPGESLSVKVIADMINAMNFKRVYVLDPHSDVLGAVLNNMMVITNFNNVQNATFTLQKGGSKVALVSPDAGANKKVMGYAKQYPFALQVIRADKTRDVATGKITGTVVYSEHLGDTNLLVVDDILDHGGTFIPLATELRKITDGTISLFVSHGLFNSGINKFAGLYDKIFVVNNMMKEEFKDDHGIMVAL